MIYVPGADEMALPRSPLVLPLAVRVVPGREEIQQRLFDRVEVQLND